MLETLLTALAIWGGSLHATPAMQHRYRSRAPRHAVTRVARTHAHVPLPKPRPVIAVATPPVPPVANVTTGTQYPFAWKGPYNLPPRWVQIWQFVA